MSTIITKVVLFEQRLGKCPLEIQLMAPCEDLPHIDMDEHCE